VLLQQVAKAIYDQAEEPVRLNRDEANLSAALELGFLQSSDDGITFSNPEVRRDYLVRHTVDLALQAWDDPKMFADFFQDAQYRTLDFGTRREVTTVVLLVLAGDHGKDVVGRVGEIARSGIENERRNHLFWSLYDPFCEALPELNVEPDKLADTLESVFEATTGDLAGGFVYGAVEKLASRSRADAEALYEVFASRPDSPVVSFTANAFVGLARFDLPEAHRRALELTEAEQATLRRAGIAALGVLDYKGGGRPDLLVRTWKRLQALKAEPDPETDYVLARAYGNLLGQKQEASEALVEMAGRPDPAVQTQVAFVLHQKARDSHHDPWYRGALLTLARVPTSQAEAWGELDHCAARCARDAPDLVVEFAEAAVLSRDYGAGGKRTELPEMLGTAFSQLLRHHPERLQAALTRWFASSKLRLHRAARDVIHRYFNPIETDVPPLGLSKPVLDELDEQTVAYALQRIMGHITINGRLLASLLLSALRREPYSPDLTEFVAAALGGHVLYNFPGEAGDYLRSRAESDEVPEMESNVARAALERAEAYFEARKDLPTLKELRPPSQRVYLLRLAQNKKQAAAMEEPDKHSVVMSLATRIPLKHGRGFFMEQGDDFTEPSGLGEISYSVEMPRGELIDPVGQEIRRMEWRSIGLDEEDLSQDETDEDAGA
jgi:hypothetical protein